MIRGLYISGTNLRVNQGKIDAISNNLANVETVGFKKSDILAESFNDVLLNKYNGSNYQAEGAFTAIEVKKSNDNYYAETDVGYFRVKNQEGVSHNKNVKFSVDKEGFLSTYYLNSDKSKDSTRGNRLLGADGKEIFVGDKEYTVEINGDILLEGTKAANLIARTGGNVIGTMSSGVRVDRAFIDFSQGSMQRSDNNLDVALDGDGFIEISTPFGTAYTRAGQFTLNENKVLQTSPGYNVVGQNGDIKLESENVIINEYGEVLENGQLIDKINIVNFTEKSDLLQLGGTLFAAKEEINGEIVDFEGAVRQGFLEGSNADAINESIRIINYYREYESGQRIIKAYDDTLGKAVNEVGKA
ncbi:MAG: flagellar hook-basal body protein [Acidaminobacteraceae bacterium]